MSAALSLEGVTPGFADPVFEAQALFRRLMDATARPGTIQSLATAPEAPAPGLKALGAVALTLLDFETPAFLAPDLAPPAFAAWVRFHCGCPLTDDPAAAAFAFARIETAPAFDALNPGDPKYPDRSTTLVLLCPALTGGSQVRIEGPGVNGAALIAPQGPTPAFWAALMDDRAQFPLGVDVILASADAVLALPRTTRCAPLPES